MRHDAGVAYAYSLQQYWPISTPMPRAACESMLTQYVNAFVAAERRAEFIDKFGMCDPAIVGLVTRPRSTRHNENLIDIVGAEPPDATIRIMFGPLDQYGGAQISGPLAGKKLTHLFYRDGDAVALIDSPNALHGLLWPHFGETYFITTSPKKPNRQARSRHG